jgi:hypothetical protein
VAEATVSREVWAIGESVPVTLRVYNRGGRPVTVRATQSIVGDRVEDRNVAVRETVILPDSTRTDSLVVRFETPTEPWWLAMPRVGAMFTPSVTGISETGRRPAATVAVTISVEGAGETTIETPVVYPPMRSREIRIRCRRAGRRSPSMMRSLCPGQRPVQSGARDGALHAWPAR